MTNYYKIIRMATTKIEALYNNGFTMPEIVYTITKEYGLSKKKIEEIKDIVIKGSVKNARKEK